jgi:acyl-coenzyme A thioesterase PaaI-like protein
MIDNIMAEDFYERYNKCFACGKDNPFGLKLRFHPQGDLARAEFTPQELYQGWDGIVHGGILFTILDEAMSYALIFNAIFSYVTAKAEIRFRSPGRIGELMIITGKVDKHARNLWWTSGNISRPDGTIVADSTGLMYATSEDPKINFSEMEK